jgi:hypothetical protein
MHFLYYLSLILFCLLQPNVLYNENKQNKFNSTHVFEQIGYAQERCCNQGCLARVVPGTAKLVAKIKKQSNVGELYFEEDSFYLQQSEIEKIKSFIKKNKSNITLIGYTDGCGKLSYNKSLSMKRANAVKRKIESIDKTINVSIYAAGEISHAHDPKNRKVYMAMSTNVTLYEPPPKVTGDVYLLDSSGSITETKFELWRRAINYHRPTGSKVYIVTTSCVSQMIQFDSISPSGATEIWFAYWFILDKMNNGQTLVIISDFDSSHSLQAWEKTAIEKKANAKGISVKLIFI